MMCLYVRSLLACVLLSPVASAEVLSSAELLANEASWDAWAESGKKLQITGRILGRVASQVQLQKLDIVFIAGNGITIPDRMRRNQRVTASGRFRRNGRRMEFQMTRFSVRNTDHERLYADLNRLPKDDVAGRYALAGRYHKLAYFFEDDELHRDVLTCRIETLLTERQNHRGDANALWRLVEPRPEFDMPEPTQQAIRFEVFALRAATRDNMPAATELRKYLPGWNHTASSPTAKERQEYGRNNLQFYDDSTDPVRRRLERLLYRSVRLKELCSKLAEDGSNGLALASIVREQLPEETPAAEELEARYAESQLQSLHRMTRTQLEELVTVLNEIRREVDAGQAVDQWLLVQENRFHDRGLEGLVRIADEYLFSWEHWKNEDHRDSGILYLKRAWKTASEVAPAEVPAITNRLERLGWMRLRNHWMTLEELERLPINDVEMAEREGRVVPGMSPEQVRKILGEPARRIRSASSRHVEEIWVYGERFTSRITVRLRRPSALPPEQATVLNVVQISGRQ